MLVPFLDEQRRENFLKITRELDALKIELNEIQIIYSNKFPEEIQEIQELERGVKNEQHEEYNRQSELNVDIQHLIKKIAQRCHPDKTDDKELNTLLIEALEAKDRNPEKVILIYEKLFNVKLNIEDDLYERKEKELKNLKSTQMYRLLQLHKQNEKIKAKMTFLEILNNKATRLKNQRRK
jgi:hypothetical protein